MNEAQAGAERKHVRTVACTASMCEFACGGCGLVTDRDVNAARNILQRGIALAGWEIGSESRPGASGNVPERSYAFGVPGQDAERCTAD